MSSAALRGHLRMLAELGKIVGAMRNLAYAEVQRLNRLTQSQARAESVLRQALAESHGGASSSKGRPLWLVIGAERGFCGGFNERLQAALPALCTRYPDAVWFVSGDRLSQNTLPLPLSFEALPGCNTAEEAADCIEAWLDMLWPRWSDSEPGTELFVLHHAEHDLCEQRLLPLPTLPPPSPGPPPLRTLPDAVLRPKLQTEWLRVALLGALFQSLQQENRWRLAQMQRAQDHLDDTGTRLKRAYFRQRQADITSELETLMSSLDVGLAPPGASWHRHAGSS
ncbi:F0F1 ATP synthase subunit gamma [Pseudogulbenkiania sp. NH8B]|uniref:F0F1 ATP synthase subunit gamma n=1 Tax=Pseudogulbenkiania sp. (strain NH8B) TaxID=748280 RepID=UPI00022798F3|nr:F0F1 ATP synthase subunit gamma [Pseudogulbenkiania sp. NH8B]BAK77285.1 F0F1 ATP synthase subunit gamma [Pseudogulbenkiania sp. NH8B]